MADRVGSPKRTRRWRFGIWALTVDLTAAVASLMTVVSVVVGVAALLSGASASNGLAALAVGVVPAGASSWLLWRWRSRNFVSLGSDGVAVVVAGVQFNRTSAPSFSVPRRPAAPFGAPVLCFEGQRTARLRLLGQGQLLTPAGLVRFVDALDEHGIDWDWY